MPAELGVILWREIEKSNLGPEESAQGNLGGGTSHIKSEGKKLIVTTTITIINQNGGG